MRLKINISKNSTIIPFNHQQKVVGTIHKWLGFNNEHGKQSNYSFSLLQGGKKTKNGLNFDNGASLYFSSTNNEILTNIYKGIKKDPTLFNGLKVFEIDLIPEPVFSNKERFYVLSPIFIKKKIDGRKKAKHFTFEDKEVDAVLTEITKKRLEYNGIKDNDLNMFFDMSHTMKKTKVINYKGIGNKASVCPIIVEGKIKTMEFLWNNGIGHSIGIGFGCLK